METLYRKYRPKSFDEVEGQQHIVRTLRNAIQLDRVGHAYLFTGPRGTGKTTLARIFSLALNCLAPKDGDPCGICERCVKMLSGASLSTIEIDAASNTGVDNIRTLREEAVLPPIDGAPYKIYIIDEVHMLSRGAFNALLKILEEPPKHIIFILATTEIQKVPETIVSRCQRFDFGRIPITNIIEKLTRIAKQEKVTVEKEALEAIALASSGGMRDAESLLSQLFATSDKHITREEAEKILGFSHQKTVYAYIDALFTGNLSQALTYIDEATTNGYNLDHFVETAVYHLRHALLLRVSPDFAKELEQEITQDHIAHLTKIAQPRSLIWIVRAIDRLLSARISMRSSFMAQIPLETATVKIILPQDAEHETQNKKRKTKDEQPSPITPAKPHIPSASQPMENSTKAKIANTPLAKSPSNHTSASKVDARSQTSTSQKSNTNNPPASLSLQDVFSVWQKCLDASHSKNRMLGTFLKSTHVSRVEGTSLFLSVPNEFTKNTLEKKENRLTVEEILGTLLSTRVTIIVSTAQTNGSEDPLLKNVMETFGDAIA